MGRIWGPNGSGLALNAADLNAIEADITNAAKVWQPNTSYTAGNPAVEPGGTLVIRNTTGTSAATYAADAQYWTPAQTGISAALAIVFGG